MVERLMTVLETNTFIKRAATCMPDPEREAFIAYIAAYPEAGVRIPETGGVRKVRWGVDARGKRGGVRVVYYYHGATLPIFLLTVYAKNERDDLSQRDKQHIRRLTATLVEEYRRRRPHGDRGREHHRRS
jgi:mRNA-degrading endonuclease RelE of RelBE toxin-antitoxin system